MSPSKAWDRDELGEGGGGADAGEGSLAGNDSGSRGGTGGDPGGGEAGTAGGAQNVAIDVVISEIMYHPVGEDDFVENHEFIELANRGDEPVALSNFSIDGEVRFTFPSDATIEAQGYIVIAKNRERLLTDVPAYELDPALVLGDYEGELSNGDGTIVLRSAGGEVIESVHYEDDFPYPVAADAFGASEQFFAADDARVPFATHQYRGYSLERVSLELPPNEVANWAPSALDGPTPGKPNGAAAEVPAAIVEHLTVRPSSGEGDPIVPDAAVLVRATFSELGIIEAPRLEWFVEYRDAKLTGEPPSELAMDASDGAFEAVIPGQPNNSIVRYRLLDDEGRPVSPRPTDPNPWHAYAVVADVAGNTPALHLFIAPADWGRLFANISGGRAASCTVNQAWDARKPAVLVLNGQVYDVRARYQGSPYNRWVGPSFSTERPYQGIGPVGGPTPMRALSWSLVFPRYRPLPDGRRHMHLNKLTQACPGGLTTGVVAELFEQAKIPALDVLGFHRLHINGGYYHYVMEREHVDEQMLERVQPKDTAIGDLFKVVGYDHDQGPWGVGDSRLLSPACGFSAEERYDATYERHSHEWKPGARDVQALIERLHAARAADLQSRDPEYPALRQYFAENFDVDALLTYKAVFNWAKVWDDYWQNHFFYRRADGKWLLIPYDFDSLMTGGGSGSFYLGEQNDPSARTCCGNIKWWNYLIDALIKAHRREFNAKLHELNRTVLSPQNVAGVVDRVMGSAGYDQTEARSAPGGTACSTDYFNMGRDLKNFAASRSAVLTQQVPKQ